MESTERLKAVRSHALTRYREHYLDRYILSPSRCGMFVARRDTGAVRTYLRFGATQQAFVEKHWPTGIKTPDVAEPVTELPTYTGTRSSLEELYYPILGGTLTTLAIASSLKSGLGFTKAYKVQLAFARAVLEDLELFRRAPPQLDEEVWLLLHQHHGLRVGAKPVPVVLVVHEGSLLLRKSEILPIKGDLHGVELPTCGYALRKLLGD